MAALCDEVILCLEPKFIVQSVTLLDTVKAFHSLMRQRTVAGHEENIWAVLWRFFDIANAMNVRMNL